MVTLTAKEMKRFLARFDVCQKTDCWVWRSGVNKAGYGQFNLNGKNVRAHRISYIISRGEIPKGRVLDHLCRNRKCVNPSHLELVTQRENLLRGDTITAKNSKKTKCKRGHPFDEENTYIRKKTGFRKCRACQKHMKNIWQKKQSSVL